MIYLQLIYIAGALSFIAISALAIKDWLNGTPGLDPSKPVIIVLLFLILAHLAGVK